MVKTTKKKSIKKKIDLCCSGKNANDMCKGGAIYGLGLIGALVYYIGTAPNFWMGVWGVIKAILWPAFLVFHAMKSLGM
jgi:hypothetical protein